MDKALSVGNLLYKLKGQKKGKEVNKTKVMEEE